MTPEETLVERIRQGLSLDQSYSAEIIPFCLQRQVKRLLRDYNFPWSIVVEMYSGLVADQQEYVLPAGFRKELMVTFYDTELKCHTAPLLKREGFQHPPEDGSPRYYWQTGNSIWTDLLLPVDETDNTELWLWYQSLDYAANIPWMIERFEDALYTVVMFRLAAELGKQEIAQTFGTLWADDRTALAIYLNELEFDNMEFVQRETRRPSLDRYPGASS